jgi:AcrR family transcriptional regulator
MDIEPKEDRRVRKTKKALREGLAELLAEKSIQNITVRELTDKADVHRSTFYANFTDIYDLYSHIEESVMRELSGIFTNAHDLDSAGCVIFLLRYISDNKEISRLVLGNNVSNSFFIGISDMFSDSCIAYWREVYPNVPTEKLKLYSRFLVL